MANELVEIYRGMSDEELLTIAERPEDLTDTAHAVLTAELHARGLELAAAHESQGTLLAPDPVADPIADPDEALEPGKVSLYTFHDSIEAGAALRHLEDADLPFELRDRSRPESGLGFYSQGYGVAMQVIVDQADFSRAVTLLRATMGLFPLQEITGDDHRAADEDEMATLGEFEERPEADSFVTLLEGAGLWCRINYKKGEMPFEIQVWAVDLDKAIALVESTLSDAPEEEGIED